MTVSYQYKVASSTSGGFTRLLFMWRGSLFKLIYRELLIFLIAFDILSILYRNLFTNEQKIIFEKMVQYCDEFISMIPLTFILGFYVAYVASRWWQQYEAIPWPDKCMHTIALYITGNDIRTRMIRRTLMRYLNLTLVLILRSISSAVKKRFPTLDHLTEVGFMTQAEKQMFLAIPNCDFNTYWVPCAWFVHVLKDTKAENSKIDPIGVKLIMEQFNEFRGKCGLLWSYDWISIPLVYTQVVTLATYSFFLVAIVARQYVEHSDRKMQMKIDIYLPVFTILQFFFFMGLLKVAEQLINPFGDDDEDFELNWLIDRHTKVSYLGVDTLMLQCPPLSKDKFFENADLVLPYTEAAAVHKKKTYRGSFHHMLIPEEQQELYLPEIIEEDSDENSSQVKTRRQSIFGNHFTTRGSDDNSNNSVSPRARRKSLFSNIFEKRPGHEKVIETGKLKTDGVGNGFNNKYKSPTTTKDGKKDTDIDRISIISAKDSEMGTPPRRGIAKHFSMMATPGSRKSRWSSLREKRRKSVPTLATQKISPAVRRDSTIWSKRRDSIMDTQWKGIRWKPYMKEDQIESLNAANLEATHNIKRVVDTEFAYVNRAYSKSTIDERDPDTVEENTTKENKEFKKDSNDYDSSRSFSQPVDTEIILHLSPNDSLV